MKHIYKASDFPLAEDLPKGPARLAVIGYPVTHSASPQMHQPALDALGLNLTYVRVEIEPGQVTRDLNLLKEAGFVGANVTVPHKLEALEHCSELTDDAKILGAVNTVLFRPEGDLGHNTDGPGFIAAIADSFGQDLGKLTVFIAGAGGGAGKAFAMQCAREGSPRIILANRSLDKIEKLKADIFEQLPSSSCEIQTLALDSDDTVAAAQSCDLIINATSIGLKESDPSPLANEIFQSHHLVYDSIYSPPKTRFLNEAEKAGAQIDNGFSLLLHQGALSQELWFDQSPDLDLMRQGLNR